MNPVSRLPTSQPPPSTGPLGQVLAKGRDVPTGLYPLTTRNDWEHQVGYDGPDTSLWPITGPPNETQNKGITASKNWTATNFPDAVIAGERGVPGPSGRPSRVGKYDWSIEPRNGLLAVHRPRGVMAPYVRSWLNDEMIRDAVDYEVRGNLYLNEWNRSMPHVYEQGNGYALAGPAWVAPTSNGGVNVDVF